MGSHRRASRGRQCGPISCLESGLDWAKSTDGTGRQGLSPSPREEVRLWGRVGLSRGLGEGRTGRCRVADSGDWMWERVRFQLWRPDRPRASPRHRGPGGRGGFGARTGVQLGHFHMEKREVVRLGVWSQEEGLGLGVSNTRDKSLESHHRGPCAPDVCQPSTWNALPSLPTRNRMRLAGNFSASSLPVVRPRGWWAKAARGSRGGG